MHITIDQSIRDAWPEFFIGIIEMTVSIYDNKNITTLIQEYESKLSQQFDITDVVTLPIIKDGRDAYKAFGKDPSRYRLATESLFRRVVKGNSLYRINNVVDIGNILSLHTRKSIAVLNKEAIAGDVLIRLGKQTDEYWGIGRGKINIDRVPLYEDSIGPFGSTTSDTERTMITERTSEILLFIISFSGRESLQEDIQFAVNLYQEYCSAEIIKSYII